MDSKYSVEELEKLLEKARQEKENQEAIDSKEQKKEKKRLKFGKKMLLLAFTTCFALIIFTMVMIVLGLDTTSLTILAGAGVGVLPVMYGIYDHYATKISLKHMEENYIPNYDEKMGLK